MSLSTPSVNSATVPLAGGTAQAAPMPSSVFYGRVFRFLIERFKWRKVPGLRQVWQGLWAWSLRRFQGLVPMQLYGYPVLVTNGNTYPRLTHTYPRFNDPILVACRAGLALAGSRPIHYLDVGTGVGDTPLMVLANYKDQIASVTCVDGDAGFVALLHHNLATEQGRVRIVHTLLSDRSEHIGELQREYASTASASGERQVPAMSLDQAFALAGTPGADVLKIDVDGFDGKVIAGAAELMAAHRPVIIFEWSPALWQRCGNPVLDVFTTLAQRGYSRLLWWDNFGHFSHFSTSNDVAALACLAEYCTQAFSLSGYHFDIIALHDSHALDPANVAAWAGDLAGKVPVY